VARHLAAGDQDAADAHRDAERHEHRGDAARRHLADALAVTLTAPMDREDLFRLSRCVDDVLNNLRDLVREFDLYGVAAEPLLLGPLSEVQAGLASLTGAVELLIDDPARASRGATDAKRNDVRLRYQEAMGTLLRGTAPVDRSTLARRELLRRVDIIGLRLAEAADALEDGAIKRSL
jgi:hypothetical protein